MGYAAKAGATDKAALLQKAKDCFKLVSECEAEQRKREQDDLKFQDPELQWDEAARAARKGEDAAGGKTAGRPTLSISKIDQPIQLVWNQADAAELGVNIHPVSEDADDETAEVAQGLYRRIERDSNAPMARLWGFDRAIKCGRGAYRVTTAWDEDSDPRFFDQEIRIERILHQSMVYFDPAAQKPDFSDGKWVIVAAWKKRDDFVAEYPKARYATASQMEWQGYLQSDPLWVQNDKGVLVVEYWYKVPEKTTIKSEVPDPETGEFRERSREVVKVRMATICGDEVLSDDTWDGKYIPIIPTIGRELQPFDDERRWVGMIRPAKDGQRLYNYAASTLVEDMATEPKVPYVGAAGQFEGHEAKWNTANVKNWAYLEYNPKSVEGTLAPPPGRMQVDTSKMQLAMMALEKADNFIQSTTAIYDPSLGRIGTKERSGRAILAAQDQSNAGTSHFLTYMAKVSMPYEARVVLDLIPKIYDRPGRITRILGAEDDQKTVMLNAPFIEQNGRPRQVPMPKPMPGMPPPQMPEGAKTFDLRKGVYSVSVSIGKSFQSRLEQGSAEIGEILSADPSLMPLIGATYFRFRDFPGAKEIADILKKVRDKQMPGLDDDKTATLPKLQAENAALKQQTQEMQAALQEASQAIETDQAKQMATIEKAKADNATKLQIEQMEQQAAERDRQMKLYIEQLKLDMEMRLAQMEQQQAERERAHQVAMAAAGGNTMTRTREGGQEREDERSQDQSSGRSSAPQEA